MAGNEEKVNFDDINRTLRELSADREPTGESTDRKVERKTSATQGDIDKIENWMIKLKQARTSSDEVGIRRYTEGLGTELGNFGLTIDDLDSSNTLPSTSEEETSDSPARKSIKSLLRSKGVEIDEDKTQQ